MEVTFFITQGPYWDIVHLQLFVLPLREQLADFVLDDVRFVVQVSEEILSDAAINFAMVILRHRKRFSAALLSSLHDRLAQLARSLE